MITLYYDFRNQKLRFKLEESTQYLRSVQLNREKVDSFSKYPFYLPAVQNLYDLKLHPRVTFIVGENGTGKSTILEGIAAAYGFNPEGGTTNFNFSTKSTHSDLHKFLRLTRGVNRAKDGFFLRAESFYNLATNIEELDKDGGGGRIIDSYGGVSLHEQSHGESFFSVFMNRFNGRGLYILDEPEAALSPSRQMAMVSRIHELVQQDSQFIIATHSPIIMAYPDSKIFEVKEGLKEVVYEETEHYQIMKTFINNREKMLSLLME